MPRETKVGLLIGLVFIVGMGALLSGRVAEQARSKRGQPAPDLIAGLVPRSAGSEEAPSRPPDARARPAPRPVAERLANRLQELARPVEILRPDEPAAVPLPRPLNHDVRAAMPRLASSPPDSPGGMATLPPIDVSIPGGGLTIGPAAGTDRVVGPMAASMPTGWTQYEVQKGDTLMAVSRRFYNTDLKYPLIYQANRGLIPNENTLRVGVKLNIPPPPAASPSAGGAVSSGPTATEGGATPSAGTPPPAPAESPGAVAVGTTPRISIPPHRDSEPAAGRVAEARNGDRTRRLLDSAGGLLMPVGPGGEPSGSGLMSASKTYRIREGDTLYRIAGRELGDPQRWREILDANKDRLPNEYGLPKEMVIRIPAGPSAGTN